MDQTTEPKRAAIYARHSLQFHAPEAVGNQIDLCRDAAMQQGFEVVEIYADQGESGASIIGRQQLMRCIADAESRRFDVIVCESLDHLTRDQAELAYIYTKMASADICICCVNDGGFVNEMHVAILSFAHQLFSREAGLKVCRGQTISVRRGSILAPIAYGYRANQGSSDLPGRREINPDEASIVARIMGEYADGVPTSQIVARLNMEGVPAPREGLWRSASLVGSKSRGSGLLRNDLYRGVFRWGKTQCRRDPITGQRTMRPAPAHVSACIAAPHLRIVSDEMWNAVQLRLQQATRFVYRRKLH